MDTRPSAFGPEPALETEISLHIPDPFLPQAGKSPDPFHEDLLKIPPDGEFLDKARLTGFGGADPAGSKQPLGRGTGTDEPRKFLGPTEPRYKAEVRSGVPEHGPLRGDAPVGGQSEIQSASKTETVDSCHNQRIRIFQSPEKGVSKVGEGAGRAGSQAADLPEVSAHRKGAALSRDAQTAAIPGQVGSDLFQERDECVRSELVQAGW